MCGAVHITRLCVCGAVHITRLCVCDAVHVTRLCVWCSACNEPVCVCVCVCVRVCVVSLRVGGDSQLVLQNCWPFRVGFEEAERV